MTRKLYTARKRSRKSRELETESQDWRDSQQVAFRVPCFSTLLCVTLDFADWLSLTLMSASVSLPPLFVDVLLRSFLGRAEFL